MSLPHFIHESLEDILSEWERDCGAATRPEPVARRQHFGKVLRAVADEMKRLPASASSPAAALESAPGVPHSHAGQLVGDYASLRASVIRQWRRKHPSPSASDLDDLVRFNEAMDRSLAELTATFSPSESQPQALFLGWFGGHARAQRRNRVAKGLHQREQHHADDNELGDGLQQPANDVDDHGPLTRGQRQAGEGRCFGLPLLGLYL